MLPAAPQCASKAARYMQRREQIGHAVFFYYVMIKIKSQLHALRYQSVSHEDLQQVEGWLDLDSHEWRTIALRTLNMLFEKYGLYMDKSLVKLLVRP
jgi:hypothetical protein